MGRRGSGEGGILAGKMRLERNLELLGPTTDRTATTRNAILAISSAWHNIVVKAGVEMESLMESWR